MARVIWDDLKVLLIIIYACRSEASLVGNSPLEEMRSEILRLGRAWGSKRSWPFCCLWQEIMFLPFIFVRFISSFHLCPHALCNLKASPLCFSLSFSLKNEKCDELARVSISSPRLAHNFVRMILWPSLSVAKAVCIHLRQEEDSLSPSSMMVGGHGKVTVASLRKCLAALPPCVQGVETRCILRWNTLQENELG